MFGLRLTLTGIDEAIAAADLAQQLMLRYVAEDLRWFGEIVSSEAKADHPYKDHTGALTRSIGYSVESWNSNHIQVNVFATALYADAVEYGTSKSRPYPFLFPKFYLYLSELQERMQRSVNRALAEAGARAA